MPSFIHQLCEEPVLICKKIYHATLREDSFVDKNIIDANYPAKDFHDMYIGEIISIMVKE